MDFQGPDRCFPLSQTCILCLEQSKSPIIARSNGFASNKLRVWGCFTPPIWGHIGQGLITSQNEQWQNCNFGAPPVSFESLPSCTWSMPSDFKVETRKESKRSIVSRFYTDMGPIFLTESDRETNLHRHHSLIQEMSCKKKAHISWWSSHPLPRSHWSKWSLGTWNKHFPRLSHQKAVKPDGKIYLYYIIDNNIIYRYNNNIIYIIILYI